MLYPPTALFTQRPLKVNCCKNRPLCVADQIISMAENLFLLLPRSRQVLFTILLFAEATIEEEELRGSPLHLIPKSILAIFVHFIFDFIVLPLYYCDPSRRKFSDFCPFYSMNHLYPSLYYWVPMRLTSLFLNIYYSVPL